MRILRDSDDRFRLSWFDPAVLRSFRIRTKLLMALIPSVILMLIATGYTTNWFSSQFLNEAVQRTVRLQTLALAHEVELFLSECKEDLLELSHGPITESSLINFWKSRKGIRQWDYAEVMYLSKSAGESICLVSRGDTVTMLPSESIPLVRPDPLTLAEKLHDLKNNEVFISSVLEAGYPLIVNSQYNRNLTKRIIRFALSYTKGDGTPGGLLILSIDVHRLRDILSLFNSSQSPIFAYIRSPELRYSYLFDTEGWIWFQSKQGDEKDGQLSTHVARANLSGTFGKPGLEGAFRPFPEHAQHWQMVRDVQQGKHGIMTVREREPFHSTMTDSYYLAYAPVRFHPGPDTAPMTYAGVGFVDRSRLRLWAGYRQIDVIFVITLCITILISILIFALSRIITRPIFDLAHAVNRFQETGELGEIQLPDYDYETSFLKYSINNMLTTIRNQVEEIRVKDARIQEATHRERVRLEDEIRTLKQHFLFQNIQEIVGLGPVIESLKTDILKAASVDADVLIIGETGTGKQLAAEAIHKNSSRASRPFISINCGALDETLLLDALFGHVKGAFTEAKADRKGAFLAAHGGTLFLDEIATASPKVQQALLRAIAMRKISPLGSDQECDVDVRLIAASNEEPKELVDQGRFREDLYYRLHVITIRTPALRDHREDIPVLAHYFLKDAGRQMNKEYVGLSQGALEKMRTYQWPGNVRELKNCITRAVAMVEGSLIHTQDIELEREDTSPRGVRMEGPRPRAALPDAESEEANPPENLQLNERQKIAFAALMQNGHISRQEYQQIIGNGLPRRTAVYDLQDMVKKGILMKTGRGPAVRYKLVRAVNER